MGPPPGPPPRAPPPSGKPPPGAPPHNHVHLHSRYVKPTESGLPPDEEGIHSTSQTIKDPSSLSRDELGAAILDMHATVAKRNMEIDHLKAESQVLARIISER
eukprot:CAMPEP_0118659318 /NCGR_PEP_ID=MMETSP0785-20121206/15046_1 /TAXON_ID=91992 /ORGANISM="Bolidomonas pacifica, Strain CCMP 1866" /LENGTH=102 /DNA_ID=CAMNT_0006552411 /DNA_START=56 /DNA_END=361 /DNA_ORIENTATION=-